MSGVSEIPELWFVFRWYHYYPEGGGQDIYGIFTTEQGARVFKAEIEAAVLEKWRGDYSVEVFSLSELSAKAAENVTNLRKRRNLD